MVIRSRRWGEAAVPVSLTALLGGCQAARIAGHMACCLVARAMSVKFAQVTCAWACS